MNIKNKVSKKLFHYQWQLIFNLKENDSKEFKKYKKIIPPLDRFWQIHLLFLKIKYIIFF